MAAHVHSLPLPCLQFSILFFFALLHFLVLEEYGDFLNLRHICSVQRALARLTAD